MYQEAFETKFLESTEEVYHAEGQMLIQQCEVSFPFCFFLSCHDLNEHRFNIATAHLSLCTVVAGAVVRALDLESACCLFYSRPFYFHAATLRKCSHTCASVTSGVARGSGGSCPLAENSELHCILLFHNFTVHGTPTRNCIIAIEPVTLAVNSGCCFAPVFTYCSSKSNILVQQATGITHYSNSSLKFEREKQITFFIDF